MNSLELIDRQIQKGTEILEKLSSMRERHTNIINVIAYIDEDVQANRRAINAWQFFTVDVLISIFGEKDNHVVNFKATISEKNAGFNYQREFREEVNKGLALLEAIKESLEIGLDFKHNKTRIIEKPTKIFISHKTEDKPLVEELVILIESVIGTDEERMFCSSIGGYDIKPGKDILSELKRQFEEYDIIFIVVHSPRYYTSAVCLNEMGAAWVLGSRFFSFLTSDCQYNMLKGAIDGKYMSIKVNDARDTVISKLNSFKDYLLDAYSINKNNFNITRWETTRNKFIERASALGFGIINNQIESNDKDDSKSHVEISAELVSRNPYIITISNRGDAIAKDLDIKIDDKCDGMIISGLDKFPLEYLKAGRHVDLNIYPCLGDPDMFKLYFTWEENGKKYSSEEIVIM